MYNKVKFEYRIQGTDKSVFDGITATSRDAHFRMKRSVKYRLKAGTLKNDDKIVITIKDIRSYYSSNFIYNEVMTCEEYLNQSFDTLVSSPATNNEQVQYSLYVFRRESGSYYVETDILLPDKFPYELISDIEKGVIQVPYSKMTRVFIPVNSIESNKSYPFIIK